MFFVLSGFVLSIRHFRDSQRPQLENFSLAGFIVSRVCRIFLPYLVVLLASAAFWHLSAQRLPTIPAAEPEFFRQWVERPTVHSVFSQAKLYLVGAPYPLVPQAWTLSVELVLSLLIPVGVLLAGRGSAWLVLAVVLASYAGASPFIVHFAAGILLAKFYRPIIAMLEPRPGWRTLVAVLGVVLYTWRGFFYESPVAHRGNVDWYLTAAGSVALLAVVSASPGLRTWLSHGLNERIGRVSYSIYLCHFAVLLTLTPRFLAAFDRASLIGAWAAGLVFTIIACLLIAWPMYLGIEAPTIALGKALARRVAAISWLSTSHTCRPARP
jgi:peptidoglycan/LPS O-acetylase OafA/YrhL